jgi:hypothetical protein
VLQPALSVLKLASRPGTALWRQAFDAVERPLAAASESWVQSDTFMDLATMAWRAQRRLRSELERGVATWLGLWGVPTRADVIALVNQLAGLERQLRDLALQLEQRDGASPGRRAMPARRSSPRRRR